MRSSPGFVKGGHVPLPHVRAAKPGMFCGAPALQIPASATV